MELQLPRGTRDFPPSEAILRDEIMQTMVAIFERYGFNPLETPLLERWEVLAAKYAGGEEILKETYKLSDQGGRELGLRYDLTTPLARFVGMNPDIKRPFKRYHIGPVYRDGPIKQGRYREFYQCDVDTVGVHSAMADAELIWIALDVFEALGFEVEVRVNHRELLKDLARAAEVPEELTDTGILSIDKLEKVGRDGVRKELTDKGLSTEQADRWLDAMDASGTNAEILETLETTIPDSEAHREISDVLSFLPDDGRVRLSPLLARGLGYYTGTIFEAFSHDPAFDGAVAAGGRWDEMIGDFLESEEPYPASGISFGLEPITELVKDQRDASASQRETVVDVYVVPIALAQEGLQITQRLRQAGLNADVDLVGRGVSDNLKFANAYGIPHVVIVGPNELEQNKVTLRDMNSGEETLLPLEGAIEQLKSQPP